MKVELIIADDKELRAAIREMIRGEVLNTARKEIKDILATAVSEQVGKSPTRIIEDLIREEVRRLVERETRAPRYDAPSFVQKCVREEVREQLKAVMLKGNAV